MLKLIVFTVLSLSLPNVVSPSRIPRDTGVEGNKPDIAKTLENAWENFQKQMEQTFSKDNMNKLANEFKEFGEKVKSAGSELITQNEKKAADVKN